LFVGTLHNLKPDFVDLLELGCVTRKLLGNITTDEDRHKSGPESLDLKPLFNGILYCTKKRNFLADFIPEWSNVTHDSELIQLIQVIFDILLDVLDITGNICWWWWATSSLSEPGRDSQFTSVIVS